MDTHTHTNVCGPPRLFVWAVSAFSSEEKAMDFYESDNPLTSDLPIAYIFFVNQNLKNTAIISGSRVNELENFYLYTTKI